MNNDNCITLLEEAIEYLNDPVSNSPGRGRQTSGCLCLHVDDLFFTGDKQFLSILRTAIKKAFDIGSEDTNNIEFVGQRIRWVRNAGFRPFICIDQSKAIESLSEIGFDKSLRGDIVCGPSLHTLYRSVLGQINWLQSRAQFHACYEFSRCASAASAPTIADCRALNKLVRKIRSTPVELRYYPLKGPLRIVGYPDAA